MRIIVISGMVKKIKTGYLKKDILWYSLKNNTYN